MPEHLTTHPLVKVAFCPVTDGDLATLHPAEQALARTLELGGKRVKEWAAGRAAARAAVRALTGDDVPIGRADDGAPIVDLAGVIVSITHGHHTAAAAAGRVTLLGIDICDLDQADRVRRVTVRFCHADERALVPAGDGAAWCRYWALKEAAAKALRIGLLDGGLKASRLASFDPPRFATPDLEVSVGGTADAAIALVLRP